MVGRFFLPETLFNVSWLQSVFYVIFGEEYEVSSVPSGLIDDRKKRCRD